MDNCAQSQWILPIRWGVRSLYNPRPLSPIYVWDIYAQAYVNFEPLGESTEQIVAWLRSKGKAVLLLKEKKDASRTS